MKIAPTPNFKTSCSNYVYKTGEKKTFSPSFSSRPEYDHFEKTGTIRASSHFRRGSYYGVPSKGFKDVENALKILLKYKKKPEILLVGIGQGQEAYSIAASIWTLTNKPEDLSRVVQFEGVDLGPKLTEEELENSSIFYDINTVSEYNIAEDSFEFRNRNGIFYEGVEFKPAIKNFIKKSFNSENFRWDTSIQEFLKTNKKTYDMFVMNNVLLYMEERDQIATLKKAKEIINPKGIIITDPNDEYFERLGIFDDWKKLASGIYQKPNRFNFFF